MCAISSLSGAAAHSLGSTTKLPMPTLPAKSINLGLLARYMKGVSADALSTPLCRRRLTLQHTGAEQGGEGSGALREVVGAWVSAWSC